MNKIIEEIDFEIDRLKAVRKGVVKTAEKKMRVKGPTNVKREAKVHAKRVVTKTGRVNKPRVKANPTLSA